MSKKNAVFSIIVILVISSFCYLSFYPIKTNGEVDDQQTDVSEFISLTPKSSSYELSKRWNYTSDYEVLSVAVSTDGKYMVAGINYDSTYSSHAIFFFNTSAHDGRPMWIYNTTSPISSVAISANGSYIVAGSQIGQSAYLFNNTVPDAGKDKEEIWYVTFESNEYVYSVDISANGTYIVMGGQAAGGDGFLLLYNNTYNSTGGHDKTGERLWYYAPYLCVNSVTISANGMYVAAGTNSDALYDEVFFFNTTDYIYNQEHNPEWSYDTGYNINSVSISTDGYYFVAASYEYQRAYLLNRTAPDAGIDKKEVWIVNVDADGTKITSVDISADDGKYIVIGGMSIYTIPGNFTILFNNSYSSTGNKYVESLWHYESEGAVNSVAITADGKYIAVGTNKSLQGNTIFLFNNIDYKYNQEHKPECSYDTEYNINSVSISNCSRYIGAGGLYSNSRGMIYLFYTHPILNLLPPLLGDDDDDGNDEVAPVIIPFGNHYLIFTAIGIVSLVIILKRKLFLSKK